MSHNIQINEYKLDKLESMIRGFFIFVKRIYKKIYRFIAKKRAQQRVQKMLKNNFISEAPKAIKKQKKSKKQIQIIAVSSQFPTMGISKAWRGVAAVFSVSFLMLTIITSQYYGPQYIEAEILVQNFTENENIVNEGIELLKYETRSVNDIDDKVEFDAGTYTNGNFEAGEDDLVAVADTDDFLTINSYGDTVADTSSNDWWSQFQDLQTCSVAEFNNGTYSDTWWDAGNNWVELNGTGLTNGTGIYTSEILDAKEVTTWTDFIWTSNTPTYKELPNNTGIESNYSAGNTDMTGNVLLMHMNESSGTIVDSSGSNNDGSYNGTGYGLAGQFNTGLDFDGSDDEITIADDASLSFPTEITASIWVYADDWSGWRSFFHKNTTTASNNDIYFEQNGGVLYNYNTINTGSVVLATGRWQHLVYTADATRERLYVDGQVVADEPSQFTGTVNTNPMIIGGSGGGGEQIDGRMDEAAVWNRALSTTEISNLYRRGANRLKFQVRSCDDVACSGESFIGPDGTGATYYSELMNSTINLPNVTLTNVIDNQYFQYRTNFETDDNTLSPELECVSFNRTAEEIWNYRKCFDIDNTDADAIDATEYQVYIDTDTSSLVSTNKMQLDGDDIRFIDTDDNILPYFIADDMNTTSTRIWLQMDNIDAGVTEEICMYYGNDSTGGISSREDVFTYSSQEEIYHVVADTAEGTITDFVSYTDNNDVSVSTYSGTLNQYDSVHHPTATVTLEQTTAISTTDPINGGYNVDGTDNLVPVSFASENFVYRMDRYTNYFSFISPWCDADVEVRNETDTIVTNGSFTITQGTHHNLTTSDTSGSGLTNDDAVMIEVTNGCPILAQHHSNVGGDSFVMAPAAQEWYGVGSGHFGFAALYDNTNITVYRSDNTSVSYTLNRGENIDINDAGSEGSEPAHRVVADNLIGVSALADSDGGEAVTFLPVGEMGYKYYIPEDIQYIAIATQENTTTTVNLYHDGTVCGVGVPDDTVTVTSAATYPGKVYFGSTTDGTNIPAGACVVSDNRIYAYYEYAGEDDEHNAWNERQNRQFISEEPTYSVGAEEMGMWNVDGVNTWMRRTPVTVSNTTATGLTEYQVLVDLGGDVSHMFGHTQTDGGDIRVAGSIGDGTDNIVYALEDFNDTAATGYTWVKVPTIAATSTATFYIYYNPGINLGAYNPILWLDAADTSTITTTGTSVTNWDDKSGNANHVDQSNAGSQPTLTTDGGNQVIEFNGSYMEDGSGLWVSGTTYTDTYTFVAFKNLVLPEDGTLFNETIQAGQYEGRAPNVTNVEFQANTNGGGALSGAYGGDTTTYHVLRFEAHDGGDRIIARDGTTIVSDTNGDSFRGRGRTFNVGSQAGGGRPQSMSLGEMLVFDGNLTTIEVAEIENYLVEKWETGPTSSLLTTGDYNGIFHTATQKANYYVVDERAVGETLSIISFTDNNSINDSFTTQIVDEGEIITAPFGSGILQTDSYSVTGPLHIGFDGDGTDSALPIAYAGTEFTYRVDRGNDVFSFYAPFADATVQIQESSGAGWTTLQTVTVSTGTVQTVVQDIVNTRVFKIISDEPILGFHQASSNDSNILYPTHLGLEEDSGEYEIYGVGTGSVLLGASSDANVTLYRSDGTSTSVVLNAANNFAYTESGGGSQGTALGYHIVSDAPIGATSYADSDGNEVVTFLSQKEFSREYVVSNPTQYMAIVARDANVTCRVYDDTGTEITIDATGTMDNIPPQTGGAQTDPYPNNIHIGGDDTSDGAYFQAGYHMTCDEPVYAYYEHHLNSSVTDETSWLTWPQVRKRAYIEPNVENVDDADEQGLFYESGKDSTTAGIDFEAYAEYTFDTSALIYGEHTYWRDVTWEEITNSRSGANGVEQVTVEVASADPSPTCATASYGSYINVAPTTLATSVDVSLPYVTRTTNTQQILFDDNFSDHSCVKMRIYLRTNNQAYAPKINYVKTGYYVPTLLDDQLNSPTILIEGATSGTSERYRTLKSLTSDAGLNGSQVFTTFENVSDGSVFTQADLDLFEVPSQTINNQFTFPPFPGVTPVDAVTQSVFDSSNDVATYFTHERSSGALETMDFIFNVDIGSVGGPQISRDFQLEISGL
ncbi:MAG: DUF2341 domain-containing protein [Candidatus Moraniibacteriota bacterium]|jgi:Concanavalin A-like lectin/glucanases superfamily/Domain of unknown function (DUF2341)